MEDRPEHGSEAETIEIPERESFDVEFKSTFGAHILSLGPDYSMIAIGKDGKPLVIHEGKIVNIGTGRRLIGHKDSSTQILDKNGKVRKDGNNIAIGQDNKPILDNTGNPIKLDDIPDNNPAILQKDYRPGFESDERKDEISRAICAMSNYRGGRLFIGVNDGGEAYGLDYDRQLSDGADNESFAHGIRNYLSKSIANPNRLELDFQFPYPKTNPKKRICIVHVRRAKECILLYEGADEVLRIRRGASSQPLLDKPRAKRYAEKFSRLQNPITDPRKLKEGLRVKFEPSFRLKHDKAKPEKTNRFSVSSDVIHGVCGMANSQGGAIYVGVDGSGVPLGLDADKKVLASDGHKSRNDDDKFERIIFDSLEESIHLEDLVDTRVSFHRDDKEYCRIDVPPAIEPVFVNEDTSKLTIMKDAKPASYSGKNMAVYCRLRFEEQYLTFLKG